MSRHASQTTISRRFEFDMGHRVTNHASQCRNFHGHRYVAIVHLSGELIDTPHASDYGMVLDFADVKVLLAGLIDRLDHSFMIWEHDPFAEMMKQTETKVVVVPWVPTAENIAAFILAEARRMIGGMVTKVVVFETPNCSAEVSADALHTDIHISHSEALPC